MSNSTMAYIALLKCEAKNAESRAKRLRETAAAIIANAEVGRKKKRKNEEASKRKDPTGYAVFFQDSYEAFKKARGVSIDSKQAHLTISRQWRDMGEAEKAAWQYKADQLKQAMSLNGESVSAEMSILPEGIEEDGLPELPIHNPEQDNDDNDEEEWASKNPSGRKSLQKVTAIV